MQIITKLKDELSAVSDPRVLGRTKHELVDILILGILGVICHAETWEEIEDFGKARKTWLKKFLSLPGGIPSHDTISRVFSIIQPKELELAFISWVKQVRAEQKSRDTICIDGKSISGTFEAKFGQGRTGLHVVNVWSTTQGIVLGQMKAKGRGNAEVVAALDLLELLDIEKMILVGDAGVGKISIINKIVEKKADYIFPIKSNSKTYFEQVKQMFTELDKSQIETHSIQEVGHGRKEYRRVEVIRKKDFPKSFDSNHFKNIKAVGKIIYERELPEIAPFTWVDGKREIATEPIRRETQTRYFITSLDLSSKGLMEQVRLQWAIENQLHWSLDVNLGEDANKTRNKVAAANFAVARKIALNLVKQDPSRQGLKSKLKKAGWDQDYLEQLLLKSKLS
jgi:predicted transposase YbfD/YdcC